MPIPQKTQGKDPRMTKKYCQQVSKLLMKENIPSKLADVEYIAVNNGWNKVLEDEYNFLHKRNIEIRRQVENKIRKFKMGAIPWSPKLQGFRDKITLWNMVYKKRCGIKTSTKKIRKLMKKTKEWQALKLNYDEVREKLGNSFNEYRKAKKDADYWKDDFIHDLAKAIADKKGS